MKALLLAHGAGSSRDHPCLIAIEHALAPLPVHRMNFDYRAEGRRAPDRMPKLLAAFERELESLCVRNDVDTSDVIIGGRSMGGRVASHLANQVEVGGLVLISYPLHPPGKPENLRVEHLPAVNVPTLVVSGTKDPFGTPGELELWLATISAEVHFEWIDGARHDLKNGDDEVAEHVRRWVEHRNP